ncbi:B12-binding domain-containing radical SAM protein [Dissulfurimicrobium hydrothermale]|uniref:B12-binding domain-containing radical SAM protein n=1 Tax=Dissulfurimicrobium hydrothermale TaxID=1750598 RepID=UPI001EDB3D03|nr:radical SAM protein [Dissulfurimicrobium hydrothermale]UKL13879.1 B12-binding domain-containing radical SAM protein [Dissulfurimicrobium hydrothermale]
MKVLLIYPHFLDQRVIDYDIRAVPIGLYYIGAVLKERGIDVEILNFHEIKGQVEIYEKILQEKQPDIIGFSIFHANRWGGIDMARVAKRLFPDIKVVFGGPGATFLWRHILENYPEVDFVIKGEGEITFLRLIERIEYGKAHGGLGDIKGLAFRCDGNAISTGDQKFIEDIDMLPNPARYFTFEHVVSSRGCPWNCTFCGSPRFWKRRVRFHSPDYFVEQLSLLYEKGVRFFYFSDDTFTLDKIRVIQICKKILELALDIRWVAISRVDYVDENVLYWMRRAGCIQISYGVESGSAEIRNRLNKDIKLQDIKRAFTLTTSYGILARAYFIYGCPGETQQTIQETIDLIDEIKPLSIIFYILDLFPGTRLYEDFVKKTGVSDDIWLNRIEDIMYFEIDHSLTAEDILSFGRRLRSHFYGNLHNYALNVELKDDPGLYSLHADFLSRLAMTFSHGDYSKIDQVLEKDSVAAVLFERALGYHPNHRAYLGLSALKQREGDLKGSIRVALEGLVHFPGSEDLSLCIATSMMNLGRYEDALLYLAPFKDSDRFSGYIDLCRKALGNGL